MRKNDVTNALHGSGPVGRFAEEFKRAKIQIEVAAFSARIRPQAEELAAIIAEMRCLPENAPVQINGVKMPAGVVAEIYSGIEHDHVMMVLENLDGISYRIRSLKTYLRTALYNAPFELEFKLQNEYNRERVE